MNSELKIRLDRIVNDLAKTEGIDGSLIVDGNGEVLSHHLLHDVDIQLFGPMANVITGSSKRLTNFSNQGEIERILVESEKGKALFLHLGNVHFIVLMKNKANVGMIMISSKRASEEITDLTKDLTPIQLEEQIKEEEEEEKVVEATKTIEKAEEKATETVKEEPVEVSVVEEKATVTDQDQSKEPAIDIQPAVEETKPETVADITEPTEEIPKPAKATETATVTKASSETTAKATDTTSETEIASETAPDVKEQVAEEIKEPATELSEPVKTEAEPPVDTEIIESEEPEEEISTSPEVAEEEESGTIPVIRPPIAFPQLKKITEIPEDQSERADLLLKIYESIFLAMSIGASKIMGVAPARGLTRKFLPVEDCKTLLDGVDVKNNSAIDFLKIKENADKIPLSDREKIFKESFGKIIAVITENYGKVMGYAAFRAMIRPEFKIINESYGHLLDELGVKEQLHPELQDFFK